AQLNSTQGSLHFRHPPVGTKRLGQPSEPRRVLAIVDGIMATPDILVSPRLRPGSLIIQSKQPALAAGRDDFILTEGKCSCMSETSDRTSTEEGSMSLGTVFDDDETVFIGERH